MSFGTNCGKATKVVWKNLAKGGPKGNQTFQRGAAPRESLITRGTSCGQISRQFLRLFHSYSDFRLQKPKRICPAGCVWTYSGFPAGVSDSVNSRRRFLKPEVCWNKWQANHAILTSNMKAIQKATTEEKKLDLIWEWSQFCIFIKRFFQQERPLLLWLLQTEKSPKGLSGKSCLKEVFGVIRLSWGKVSLPNGPPGATCLFTRLEESSLVPAGFLTAQFLQKS